jgi:CRISPR-associated endonuclease/helicase Cas3
MSSPDFSLFFATAYAGQRDAFPWQSALARSGEWPTLLNIPTGLGKTAGVVLAWAFKRLTDPATTPRRLVFCLPMRTLVEQTETEATRWMGQLGSLFEQAGQPVPVVHRLLGGDVDAPWDLCPEQPMILVGTQDMLLSRALNRGYAMSRYRWPMHYALLNNDALWVYDETQLMGVGLPTGAQVQAIRERMGTALPTRSLWMSATLGDEPLDTVDHPRPADGWPTLTLSDADHAHPLVQKRTQAHKAIDIRGDLPLWSKKAPAYSADLAALALSEHRAGSLTLVVVNRVVRAQQVAAALRKAVANTENPPTIGLIHSRYRSGDRRQQMALLTGTDTAADRIIVATQAIEAGVDVSATTMISELAPWSSLVQRFGRCNRYGEVVDARVIIVDPTAGEFLDPKTGADAVRPYDAADFEQAATRLNELADNDAGCGPQAVGRIAPPPYVAEHPVIRRKDLVDLFDTTPDLTGYDIDVAPYIRDGDDRDVFVAWRAWDHDTVFETQPPDVRDEELVRVPLHEAIALVEQLEKANKALRDAGKGMPDVQPAAWVQAVQEGKTSPKRWRITSKAELRAGVTILLNVKWGGYGEETGFALATFDAKGKATAVPEVPTPGQIMASDSGTIGDDPLSQPANGTSESIDLPTHTEHVCTELDGLLASLKPGMDSVTDAMRTAARWHDAGKAHPAFQHMLYDRPRQPHEPLLAKSGSAGTRTTTRAPAKTPIEPTDNARNERPEMSSPAVGVARRYLRHELASAFLYLQQHAPQAVDTHHDLVAWIIACHHGKVRLALRPHPDEHVPAAQHQPFALGVHNGDELPAIDLGGGASSPAVALDMGLLRFGAGSWTDRMVTLRDNPAIGPWRMAYFETLLRAADQRASARERDPNWHPFTRNEVAQ